jgi:hypothetical protein
VRKAHTFKVFRKSTKFKRFNRGLVDFVRRKNIKRKKSINYITLSYLSSNWSKYYLNLRSITRFSQSTMTSNFTFESLSPDLARKLAIKMKFTKGLHLTSLPTQRAFSMIKIFSESTLNIMSRTGVRGALLSVNDHDFIHSSLGAIGASNNVQLRSKYHLTVKALALLKQLDSSGLFRPTLSVASCIRSILVLSTLLTTFK